MLRDGKVVRALWCCSSKWIQPVRVGHWLEFGFEGIESVQTDVQFCSGRLVASPILEAIVTYDENELLTNKRRKESHDARCCWRLRKPASSLNVEKLAPAGICFEYRDESRRFRWQGKLTNRRSVSIRRGRNCRLIGRGKTFVVPVRVTVRFEVAFTLHGSGLSLRETRVQTHAQAASSRWPE